MEGLLRTLGKCHVKKDLTGLAYRSPTTTTDDFVTETNEIHQ